MEIKPDPTPPPMRDKDPEFQYVPEIKKSKWRRLYEDILKIFVTILRAFADAKQSTQDKKKEAVKWAERILDLILSILKLKG